MRKRGLMVFIVTLLLVGALSGCAGKDDVQKPAIEQVRNICELATVKCYYHNVAISEKKASHLFEKDRKFWIEYTGVANLGIDMSKVEMKMDGTNIKITIPNAKILSISIDKDSLNDDSFMTSQDGFINKNEITAEDQTEAIDKAQKKMEQTVKENSALLASAQERAKTLIENYINQLGDAAGEKYTIEWAYCEDDSTSDETEVNTEN